MAWKDQRLDKIDWLISQGRWDDAEYASDRYQDQALRGSQVYNFNVRHPEQRRKIMEGRNRAREAGDVSAVDFGEIELESFRRVFSAMDAARKAGRNMQKTRRQVVNEVTDDMGVEYEIPDGHPLRGRLYAKVIGHVERWERKYGNGKEAADDSA